MIEDLKARRYRVHYFVDCGGCVSVSQVIFAYNAADARYQIELSMEGQEPKDPCFRVVRIEPGDCVQIDGDHLSAER